MCSQQDTLKGTPGIPAAAGRHLQELWQWRQAMGISIMCWIEITPFL